MNMDMKRELLVSRETFGALGRSRALLDLDTLVEHLGGKEFAGKMAYASPAAVTAWIKLGHVPRDRAMLAAKGWGVPVLMIHDPWIGSPDAADIMTYEETSRFLAETEDWV